MAFADWAVVTSLKFSQMTTHRLFQSSLVPFALLLFGCGTTDREEPGVSMSAADAGHQRMLNLLEDVRERTTEENPYLGDAAVRRLKSELASLPDSGGKVARWRANWHLGRELLRVGETKSAIEHLNTCEELFPDVNYVLDDPRFVQDQIDYQLAVAYLRLAEDENCVCCQNEESCIFPIRGTGVHGQPEPAKQAIRHLTALLERNPQMPAVIWLLNVAHMTIGGYPDSVPESARISADLFEADQAFPRFRNIAGRLKLDVLSLCGGMVVDDFNADGRLDVITSDWNSTGQLRCFFAAADGTFADNTTEAGLEGEYGGLNLVQADYDNDGDVDVLVLRGAWLGQAGTHPNSLLANNGQGRFRDVTFEAGLGEVHRPTQTAGWSDYDNDGDLDLYIGNEEFPGQLFNNDGQGHFVDVAAQAGVADGGVAKAVTWGDYNSDRYPDLYVSNLAGANRLFLNNQDGTFVNVAAKAGVAGPQKSFPTWFWDFNNDGHLDIFVGAYWAHIDHFAADYLDKPHKAETDRLFQNDGQGGFLDVTKSMNLDHVTLPMGSNFGDLDNDGYPDFYLGTGFPSYDGLMPNRMFHNQQGASFVEVTTPGGFGHLQKGHGVAFADFDHDGDEDIFVELGGAYLGDAFTNAVFENPGFGNHSITIKLIGRQSNRSAIGVRIRADIEEDGVMRSVYKWVNSGGSFGANPLRQHLGLGGARLIKRLEIYWPTSDTHQQFEDVAADQMIILHEGDPQFKSVALRPPAQPN